MRPTWLLVLALAMGVAGACSPRIDEPPVRETSDKPIEPDSPEALAKRADIPIYPGAKMPEGVSNVRSDGLQTRYEIVMLTQDSPAEVNNFYREELKMDSKGQGFSFSLIGTTPNHHYAKIDVFKEGDLTKVVAVTLAAKEERPSNPYLDFDGEGKK